MTLPTSHRHPDQTREKILDAAFNEIHRHGFQAASIANILADTGLTKGALYHHYPDKKALGLAIIEETIRPHMTERTLAPLREADRPFAVLRKMIEQKARHTDDESLALGCPLNNLMQEMSPIDEDFRASLGRLFQEWVDAVADALKRGQGQGEVRTDVNVREAALFIVSAAEGCIGMSKNMQSPKIFRTCLGQLLHYLDGLAA